MLDVRQKRRIYDITNVLEGIGLIEKETKNTIRWKCVRVCVCVCVGGWGVGSIVLRCCILQMIRYPLPPTCMD